MKLALPTLPANCTCLVDLTGFLHRLANMPGPRGMDPRKVTSRITNEPTWGIVGALNQLNTLAKLNPGHIIGVLDSSQNGFRQQLLDTYKRKSSSNYIGSQSMRLSSALPLLGIPVLGANEQFPGMEAEDVISKAIDVIPGKKVVVSYDKDLLQLVREDVLHYNPQKKELASLENIDAIIKRDFLPTKAVLTPSDIAVFLAITGDATDGVKSVGGIGPATLGIYYEKIPAGLANIAKLEKIAAEDSFLKQAGNKPVTADWRLAFKNLEVTDLRTERQRSLVLNNVSNVAADPAGFRSVLEELTLGSFLKDYENWVAPFSKMAKPSLSLEIQ